MREGCNMLNSLVEEMNGGWLDFDDRMLVRLKPKIESIKAALVALTQMAKDRTLDHFDCLEVSLFGKPPWTGARWLGMGRR